MQDFLISIVREWVALSIGVAIGVIVMALLQANGPDDL